MTIEESKHYFETHMKWVINESTFKVIEESSCTWAAQVTTTHMEENRTFLLLVQHDTVFFVVYPHWQHELTAWLVERHGL